MLLGSVNAAALTDAQLRASAVGISGDVGFTNVFTGPFGDLIAQPLTPLVQMDFIYGLNTQTSSNSVVTTGVVDTAASILRLQTGTGAAGSAIFQSRRPAKYRAGQGVIARFTTLYTTGVANSTQILGVGGASDGYFFGFNGATFGILHRNAGADTWIAQTAWNGDKCNGAGDSGFNWDVTKGNVCMVKYPYLGYGNITFWVQSSTTSNFILCHTIRYANSTASVQVSNPSLYAYGQVVNSGNTSNIIAYVGSFGIFLVGERSFIGSPKWAADNNKASITAETNLLSIRNATTYNGVANKGLIRLNSVSFANGSATPTTTGVLRVRIGATVGGAPSFTPVSGSTSNSGVTITSGNSIASIDTAGTTATGGTYIFNTSASSTADQIVDLTPLGLFVAPGEILTLSGFATASSSQSVSVNWTEDI